MGENDLCDKVETHNYASRSSEVLLEKIITENERGFRRGWERMIYVIR
jgi:hypothetical protein